MQTSIDELLAKLNIPTSDQAQIIAEYGDLDPDTWWAELELIAMALHVDQPPSGAAPICEPWRAIWLEMYYNGRSVKESIIEVLSDKRAELNIALQGALAKMQQKPAAQEMAK